VAGKNTEPQHLADRTVYPIAVTGPGVPLSDVLRDIPAVDVDLQGGLTLRGNSNVTILVDGQPSDEFKGPNRAQLLQQLPGDRYERVEVMTAPSAAYSPEGAAGVINLITRKGRAKPTLTLSARVDSIGRLNAGASGETSVGKVKLTGDLSVGTSPWKTFGVTDQQLSDPAMGAEAQAMQTSESVDGWEHVNGNMRAVYDLAGRDTLTAEIGGWAWRGRTTSDATYQSSAVSGPFDTAFDSTGLDTYTGRLGQASLNYRRALGGDDHDLTVRAAISSFDIHDDNLLAADFTQPESSQTIQDAVSDTSDLAVDLHAQFDTHVLAGGKLALGYDLNYRRYASSKDETFAGEAIAPIHDLFTADQVTSALFATLDEQIGRLDFLPGLRLEAYQRTASDPSLPGPYGARFFAPYPTLAVKYQIDAKETVTAKYSRRVARPALAQLDPVVVQTDPLSYSQGNAALKPSYTDAWEVDLARQGDRASVELDGFYRSTTGEIAPLVENLGGGRTLNTSANVDAERHAGIELTASDKLSKALNVSLDLTAQHDQFSGAGVVGDARGGAWVRGKLKANWSPSKADFVQISYNANSRQATTQGAQMGVQYVIVGYRRRLTDRVSLELRATDPFATFHQSSFVELPDLSYRSDNWPRARSVSIGLAWALGGAKPQSQTRDFDTGVGSR
jgi:outer membrane receptor protein involved in Fe transport